MDNAHASGLSPLARGRRLEDVLAKPGREILATFAAVYCDECGAILKAATVDELAELAAAEGWRITPPDAIGPDLCSRCQ